AAEVYRELIKQYPDAPEAVDARLRLAELYRAYLKNGRAAVDLLTAVAQRRPTEAPRLTYEVAKIYFGLGDYGQAGFEAQKVVRQDGGTGLADDALLLTGQALAMVEGRRDEASAAFESLATRFADSDLRPHALFESGKMRAEAGDGEKAIELWVAALSSHPDPKLVQAYIERARRRIRNTTPRGRIGDEVSAFDRDLPRPPAPAPVRTRARNSVEAAGGSSEEAAHEHRGE
ncbi:MAG TPA: tetratricopeptide repeat protein, partial [Myxococcaceae bacterium]|nr:tetratricopeptide repeat protein [Myxococcaceae bacterium]